jgi:hypothetical protein
MKNILTGCTGGAINENSQFSMSYSRRQKAYWTINKKYIINGFFNPFFLLDYMLNHKIEN